MALKGTRVRIVVSLFVACSLALCCFFRLFGQLSSFSTRGSCRESCSPKYEDMYPVWLGLVSRACDFPRASPIGSPDTWLSVVPIAPTTYTHPTCENFQKTTRLQNWLAGRFEGSLPNCCTPFNVRAK